MPLPALAVSIAARLCAATLLFVLTATATAGPKHDEFDEGSSPDSEQVDWPQAAFASPEQRASAFLPDQRFAFRAQWGLFRKAGVIEIATVRAATDDNESTTQVVMNTASAGLIRKFYSLEMTSTTLLDNEFWRVVRDEVDGEVRSELTRTIALLDYQEDKLVYTDLLEPEKSKTRELPYDTVLDYASTILQLRSWDPVIGSRFQMCVTSKGKFYFVELEAMETERIKTNFGERKCVRIEPVRVVPKSKTFREGGKMSVWLTADSERIPVRVDIKTSIGTARMLLEEYSLGSES